MHHQSAVHFVKVIQLLWHASHLRMEKQCGGQRRENGTGIALVHFRIRSDDGADGPGAPIAEDKNGPR